jgi:ABC-type Zn uptake system ZnuABC Zn-binding protein ZnuA
MNHRLLTLILLIAAPVVSSCRSESAVQADGRPVIVATTTMLEDLVRQLGGEAVVARGLISPGADPHLYQPRPADARLISQSQMVVINGLYLEGWIENLVRHAGGERPVVVASVRVDPIRMENSPGGVDPHFWFDLKAWRIAAQTVGEAMIELLGPETSGGREVVGRLAAYEQTLEALDGWVRAQLDTIARDKRVLITSHDAFNYFGRAYDIDVEAIQGISTEQEASQRDVANMIELVRRREAPAVFVETSVNPALISQVARETGARLAGPLYSDSLGVPGSGAETFVMTVVENVRIIVEALDGTYTPFEGVAVGR